MSQPRRLPTGGRIDRAKPLAFEFNGRRYTGFAGDTLASALLANDVHLVARSFKEHRPRGILSAGPEEANALVEVEIGGRARRTPSVCATRQPLIAGLVARSQHCWPSVGFDLGAVAGWFHPLLPAGFYNKTFFWPSWESYEPAIRRLAGIAAAPTERDPDRYAWRNVHCDLLVVGAGAAGLVAALTAAQNGARVLLIDSDHAPGGGLRWRRAALAGGPPRDWLTTLTARFTALPGTRLLGSTTVVGAYGHGVFAALEDVEAGDTGVTASTLRQRWWRIRARRTILATGAIEQPLVFPHNDRPGILLADAALQYLRRYAVAVGRRVVVATNNDTAYRVALELRGAGVEVPCVVDNRAEVRPDLARALAAQGIALHAASRIATTAGRRRVASVQIVSTDGQRRRIACDTVAMSGGWNPAAQLYGQAGGRLRFDSHRGCLVPDGQCDAIHPVGAAAGEFAPRAALDDAARATAAALTALGLPARVDARAWEEIGAETAAASVGELGYSASAQRDRAWVDFAHDVTAADIDLAVRENLSAVEHLKRYTTYGMSLDQGKTSNLNALAILAERTGRPIASVGTTQFRPPVTPVTLGAIAGGRLGRFLRPSRLLPSHDRQVAASAQFEEYGPWKRPVCYPRAGESEAATIEREVSVVRSAAGLFEASPLGKIVVRGPDAAEFLERIYANRVADLEPGRVRYGLMLTEKGVVLDDGVCARLGPDEFWVGTSSASAVRIAAWLEEWLQCQWPELRAVTTDITSGWATVTVAGPRARDIVRALPCDIEFTPEAFPHMRVRSGRLGGVPCRVFRVSFTGEASYEINVPAQYGAALWDALVAAGAPFGAMPIGVEALLVLRAEKGYLHVGADTDGTTVPDDIGCGAMVARKQTDFVGRRSLSLAENVRPDRLQLVGLRCVGPSQRFEAGGHLVAVAPVRPPVEPAGILTSACFSPTLGAHIGLGMLRRGRARMGEIVTVYQDGGTTRAEVVPPVHYDPTGERLRG
jgi:sarcosine oxidase subunit alpha